ncbi:MAG: hypothetical protein L6R00_19275 [Phycisphaerae bacterium]|nr:hypothetical protein [Phycisphaerae bacterium]
MARSRRGTDVSDPFDLFLDTLCNAFGGIIFIMLLVCIQLPFLSRQDPEQLKQREKRRIEKLDREASALESEVASLRAIRDRQDHEIARLPRRATADGVDQATYDRVVVKSRRSRDELRDLENRIASADHAELRRRQAELEDEIAQRKRTVRDLRDKLADAASGRKPRTFRVPRESDTAESASLSDIELFIRYGRLYWLRKYGADASPIGWNEDDIELQQVNPIQLSLKPKNHKGLRANDSRFAHLFITGLSGFSHERHRVICFIWPDSHDACLKARQVYIQKGYREVLKFVRSEQDCLYTGGSGYGRDQ